jgi:hypothetical protein
MHGMTLSIELLVAANGVRQQIERVRAWRAREYSMDA